LDDVVTVAAVLLRLPGAAALHTGSPVELAGKHVRFEDMDGLVEDKLDDEARDWIALHELSCAFCAGQLAAYRSAVERVSAQLHRPAAS
jgi:hypothetical protein